MPRSSTQTSWPRQQPRSDTIASPGQLHPGLFWGSGCNCSYATTALGAGYCHYNITSVKQSGKAGAIRHQHTRSTPPRSYDNLNPVRNLDGRQ